MSRPILSLIATALLVFSSVAQADEDQSRRVGDVEIYYSVIVTDQLPEAIAKRYQLTRAADRGMLQVTVRSSAGGGDRAMAAKVSGTAQSLGGQPQPLRFREHNDGGEPLYIAEFRLTRPDTWRYTLDVLADGLPAQQISFQREVGPE